MRSTDFFLPVSTSCTCGRCDVLGCCSSGPVTLCDVAVALEKARVANSQTIVLPQNWIYHPEAQQIGQMIESRKFNTKTQLRWGQGDQFFKNWMRSDKPNVTWILEAADAWMPADFEEIETKCESEYFFLTRRSWDLADKISSLPQGVLAHLQLYTPHFSGSENSNMTVFEIHQLVEDLLQREIAVRPLMGRDIWDPRLDPQLDLEPLGQPRFSTVRESCDITISIVIPSYQNCNHLLATLDHLGTQTLSTQKFEIILVDDGSTDQTEDQVKAWLLQHPEIQLTYLYLPRPAPRAMGDANYRAGVARNFGVRHSRGHFLCFLDSDILVRPEFLLNLLTELTANDLVQVRRLNLKPEVTSRHTLYASVDRKKDIIWQSGGYWENFVECESWMALSHYWKYTCTYGLAMKRSLFESVGRIRKNYIFYGFEDVDLGYRLAQQGVRFFLSREFVYHLYHRTERSEFGNDQKRRQRLLAKTAKIFYLNYLDPQIFNLLRSYMLIDEPLPSIWRTTNSFYQWRKSISWRLGAFKYFAWRIYWPLSYPVRKIYYFLRYQVQKLWMRLRDRAAA